MLSVTALLLSNVVGASYCVDGFSINMDVGDGWDRGKTQKPDPEFPSGCSRGLHFKTDLQHKSISWEC